jgi:hypothetical protein
MGCADATVGRRGPRVVVAALVRPDRGSLLRIVRGRMRGIMSILVRESHLGFFGKKREGYGRHTALNETYKQHLKTIIPADTDRYSPRLKHDRCLSLAHSAALTSFDHGRFLLRDESLTWAPVRTTSAEVQAVGDVRMRGSRPKTGPMGFDEWAGVKGSWVLGARSRQEAEQAERRERQAAFPTEAKRKIGRRMIDRHVTVACSQLLLSCFIPRFRTIAHVSYIGHGCAPRMHPCHRKI